MDHLNEIEKWRATLPLNLRLTLNHPSVVLRRWKAATINPNTPSKTSAITKLKEVNIKLQQKLHRAERELSLGGGDLWSPDDSADDIATVMVAKLSPSKAEHVARAVLKKLSANTRSAAKTNKERDKQGSLRRNRQRLDHRNAAQQRRQQTAVRVLGLMHNGAALYRCNRPDRTIWVLSTGEFVLHETAIAVLRDSHVEGVGDCLFGAELSQTFRYISMED
jgi:hypothetical protein